MVKEIVSLVLVIFLIGFASAEFSISPSQINLGEVYPAETYQINLTITTDIDTNTAQVLYFPSTNQFTITPNEIIVHNGENNITINITISPYVPIGQLTLDLLSYVQAIEVASPPQIIYQGGGGGVVYRNNTIVNSSCPSCEAGTEELTQPTPTDNSSKYIWIWLAIIGGIIVIVIIISLILTKRRNQEGNWGNDN